MYRKKITHISQSEDFHPVKGDDGVATGWDVLSRVAASKLAAVAERMDREEPGFRHV